MKNIWFISDTHFNHDNVLTFTGTDGKLIRPGFDDINHMNEYIIEQWNNYVQPGDKVYHLGDVFFGAKERFGPLWARLRGKKRLVLGNHDDAKFLAKGDYFSKILLWRGFKEAGLICTHIPIHESSFRGGAVMNLHGHTHEKGSPEGPYKSCCVEMTGYRPLNLDELYFRG